MARADQEAVDTFIGITGLPETLAVQILQEHGGDLNRAVNAHFSDGDRSFARETAVIAPRDDFMDIDEPVQVDPHEFSRNLNLPSLLNPDFRGSVFDGASEFTNHAPFVSHPSERRVIPIETENENGLPRQSDLPPTIEDVSGRPQVRRRIADDAIVIEDEDDAADNVLSAPNAWDVHRTEPSAPLLNSMQEPDPDIEEEMIRAAIEASKREADRVYSSEQFGSHNGSEGSRSQFRDTDAQVSSSSFEGAGQENLLREHVDHGKAETVSPEDGESQKPLLEDERLEMGRSFIEGQSGILVNDAHHRQRSRHLPSGSIDSSTEVGEDVVSAPLSQGPQQLNNTNFPQIQQNNNGFPADEWGGISSTEHDEAVMLEAAMFGGIPETSDYNAFAAHRVLQPNLIENLGPYIRPEPRPPSPNLTAQRMLREQQDDEYMLSLQADIEKAEARRLEEQAARDAALEEQKRKEVESLRKLDEEQVKGLD
uniref:Plant UBX domain-containing protein 8 n=1 Tax=Kalanchoe fedtschenkoi TaxID=63787 RepID=A0A7N0RBF5_KALFE